MATISSHRIIYNNSKRQFWQCGVWVDRKSDATVYPDETEASLVVALRRLGNVEILHPTATPINSPK